MRTRLARWTLSILLLTAGVALAQPLSQQVLQLLDRANTWTALQTFTDVTITGTCTGCGGAGGGTVTSVAMSVAPASVFDISGTPIVGSGTLAFSMDTQADNLVLAGPNGGGPSTPAFRALADADIPDILTLTGSTITWSQIADFTGSSLGDLETISASDLSSGSLALARLTDGVTAGVPLVAGGAGDPNYAALDLTSATSISGELAAANFPALTGDITTAGGSLATDLSSTGVVAATYGSTTTIPQFTVDDEGRITTASSLSIGSNALLDASRHSDTAADAATRGSVIVGNASNQWDEVTVGAAGTVLRSDGTDVAFSTDGSGLTALNADNVSSGTLVLARGGTNGSLAAVNGGVVYSTATAMAITAAGTASQCLISNGAAAPTWGACATLAAHALLSATHSDTVVNTVSRGSIIYGNSTPNWDELTIGASGTVLRSDGTDVSWSTDGTGLASLNASALSIGTVPLARLSAITYTQHAVQTSAQLAAVISDETGTGVLTYATSPTFTTGITVNGTVTLDQLAFSATAPTISSGFGTSPSVSAENGTIAFRVDVGTGGAATSGVIGLPTATTGWNCWVDDLTAQAANDGDERTVQTASSTTTATVENQTVSTGAAVAWSASDVLLVSCFAY